MAKNTTAPKTEVKAAAEVKPVEVKTEVKPAETKAEVKTEAVKAAAPKAEKAAKAPKTEKAAKAPKAAAEKKPAAKKAAKTETADKKPAAKKTSKKAAKTVTYEAVVDSFKAKVKAAKAPVDVKVAAQVKLEGAVDGILYVLVANGVAVVEPFDYKGADIEIVADTDAFTAVVAGKKSIADAIADGSVKMQGNAGKAILLAKVVF